MPKQFLLEITTPDRLFVMEMVDMVVLPAGDGEQGILAGHEKMVLALVSGVIRVQNGASWREASCAEGYAMVYDDQVIVLVQSVEWAEEIDETRAEAALRRAEHRALIDETERDRVLTRMALGRARARLRVVRRSREKR